MITVSGLTKYYADNLALDSVSFEVDAGEIVGFLGPNGAGKSTTMKILTCFLPPTAGRAEIAGYDILDEPMQVRRRLGYMPENVPLYTEMRVGEYLSFRAKIKDISRRERKAGVERVVERCWLKDVARQTVGTLSKGYRQRVGLADALLGEPEILILDEPTIGLDPSQVRQVRSLIHELGRDRTLLVSTHILPEVEAVCDKVVIINRGRIAAQDSVAALRQSSGESRKYYLEVAGPEDQVRAALLQVEGLADLQPHQPHAPGEGVSAFTFACDHGSRTAQEAASRVVQGGWGLRELRRDERTLEDVFVDIVSREEEATP